MSQIGSPFGHQVTSLSLLGSKVGNNIVSLALPHCLGGMSYWHHQLVLGWYSIMQWLPSYLQGTSVVPSEDYHLVFKGQHLALLYHLVLLLQEEDQPHLYSTPSSQIWCTIEPQGAYFSSPRVSRELPPLNNICNNIFVITKLHQERR